jgi:hypothetical protein
MAKFKTVSVSNLGLIYKKKKKMAQQLPAFCA